MNGPLPPEADDLPANERALWEGEARFRAFMAHSPAIGWMKDEAGRYVYVNGLLERLFDVGLDDVRGKTDFDWFPEELAGQYRRNDLAVLASDRPMRVVESGRTADGCLRSWLVIKFPVRDAAGRRYVGGMAVDITEQKALEGRLAEQLRRANELNAELTEANARLMELATTDGLTGLKNYRHFREALGPAISLAIRQGKPLSVAMVDVDEFKRYNDAFGHQSGDDVLCAVATILRATLRGHDLIARYGGEEFVVLLPDTDAEGARAAAERMRAAIAGHPWQLRPISVSIGVATMEGEACDPNGLVEQADGALYRSKRAGRDRVTHQLDLS